MFSRTESNRSLFHHHDHPHPRHHHHGGGPFLFGISISRLRPALYYFIFAVVITTFLYCLLFYEPESGRHHPHRRFRHYQIVKHSLISSSSSSSNTESSSSSSAEDIGTLGYHLPAAFLLDEFIRNANVHFYEYYHTKTSLVPDEFETILEASSSSPVGEDAELRQKNQRNLLVNVRYETAVSLNDTKQSQQDDDGKYRDELDAEDEDYLELVDDPDSIEHYLEQLGFNIRHITRYLLHNNQTNINNSNATSNPITTFAPTKTISSQSSSKLVQISSHTNLSSITDILEFYTTIPPDSPDENNLVIFVTALHPDQYNMGYRFLKSFERYRQVMATVQSSSTPKMHLRMMVYDLGLSMDKLYEIESLCNSTWEQSIDTLCKMRKFNFSNYPSHVYSDLKSAAYRSIILQEMLRDIHQVSLLRQQKHKIASRVFNLIWLDPHYRFLPETIRRRPSLLTQLLASTRNISGISSWPIEAPTSALTHPRMCEYFHTTADNFYFHRMIRSSHLALSIEDSQWQAFEYGVMLPWVRCALTQDCIAPLGSQWRSSCRLDKKPHYRYSGCHHYDMSALNVVLGIAFNFTSADYSASYPSQFFAPFYKLALSTNNKQPTTKSPSSSSWGLHAPTAVSTPKPWYDDFDYTDYDPGSVKHRVDESSLFESDDRFDRIHSDADLPDYQLRPVTSSSSSASSSNLLLSPKLMHFRQPQPKSAFKLLAPKSSSSSLATSPEDLLRQKTRFHL